MCDCSTVFCSRRVVLRLLLKIVVNGSRSGDSVTTPPVVGSCLCVLNGGRGAEVTEAEKTSRGTANSDVDFLGKCKRVENGMSCRGFDFLLRSHGVGAVLDIS